MGGLGGFSEGMCIVYEFGFEWIWFMDDDVEVFLEGFVKMGVWSSWFKSIQGCCYDYDGSEFYWQYCIVECMGILIFFVLFGFDEFGYKEMNSGCFEGMFIYCLIVCQIGLFDLCFFIYWDDQMYGWFVFCCIILVIVDEFVLCCMCEIKQWDMGICYMNVLSNVYCYYIMCNCGFIKQYYCVYGVYNLVLFVFGFMVMFFKELIWFVFVEWIVCGISNLFCGICDGVKVGCDCFWQLMVLLEV